MSNGGLGHNSMTLVAGLVVVPHLTDVIPRALREGVPGGASAIGPNPMNPEGRVVPHCAYPDSQVL